MINKNVQFQPNFTSTFVPKTAKLSYLKIADKLDKYFYVKGFGDTTPQKMREQINLSQAGISINKDGVTVVGKDREADEFIAKQLRPEDIRINYIEDTPKTVFDNPIFDITI